MLHRFRKAGLVWPTLLAVPALAFLIGLGTWQLQRKAWKEGLIEQLVTNAQSPPIDLARLEDDLRMRRPAGGASGAAACLQVVSCRYPEYRRVRVWGRFEHDGERHLFAPDPRLGPGYNVFTPLVLDDGRVLIVNRGFVPSELKSAEKRTAGLVVGKVELVGLLRASGDRNAFTPDNDAARNMWYWRDLPAMAGCGPGGRSPADAGQAGQPGEMTLRCDGRNVVAAFIDAEAEPANPGGWPKGGATNVDIPNRHLEYAITWYGLAGTLVGVYLAFVLGRLRAARDT